MLQARAHKARQRRQALELAPEAQQEPVELVAPQVELDQVPADHQEPPVEPAPPAPVPAPVNIDEPCELILEASAAVGLTVIVVLR